jgi:serine/threonine-protein kinase
VASANSSPESPDSASRATAAETPLKPWSETDAVITGREERVTTVRAETVSCNGSPELTFEDGQSVGFEKMRRLDVLKAEPANQYWSKATVLITLVSGDTLSGRATECELIGTNDFGRFSRDLGRLKRVEFHR